MKFAVFGKSGQLSESLQRYVNATSHTAVFYDRTACNLAAPADNIRHFAESMPDVDIVVIAAAYTGVVQAEDDQETAFAVNARAPAILADVCYERSIPLIYISTDYVFDGAERTPYQPGHDPNPLNVYGQSKRQGELAVLNAGGYAVVLRTSWLFGGSGRNFMTTMLGLEENGKRLKVIGDQIGRPTYVGDLAKSVIVVAEALQKSDPPISGIFHVTNTGQPVSWAGFAREIFNKSGTELLSPVVIDEVLTKEYEKKVARPAYSVLDVSSFEKTFKVTLRDWREGLELALEEWRQN